MDYKDLKKIKGRNLAINAGLCLGSIAAFGFNPLALCFCYIGTDIALSVANSVAEKKMIKGSVKKGEADSLKDFINDYSYHYGYKTRTEVNELLTALKAEQDRYQALQDELKAKQEEAKKQELSRKIKGYESVVEIIDSFIEFYEISVKEKTEVKIKGLKKVYKEFVRLKENLSNKPEACGVVNGSLYTYTNEMVNLISNYDAIPKEKRSEYEVKYIEMLEEFLVFLQQINRDIDDFSVSDMNLDLETLVQELREINNRKGVES